MQNLINDIEHSERRITELEKEVDTLRLLPGPISNGMCIGRVNICPATTSVRLLDTKTALLVVSSTLYTVDSPLLLPIYHVYGI